MSTDPVVVQVCWIQAPDRHGDTSILIRGLIYWHEADLQISSATVDTALASGGLPHGVVKFQGSRRRKLGLTGLIRSI